MQRGGVLTEPQSLDDLYRHLVDLHEAAFQSGRYELGYHLLAAALHAAEDLDDMDLLAEVGKLAEERQTRIDRQRPDHRLSSTAAKRRGNPAQYSSLVAIVAAVRGRITADRALQRSQ